MGTQIEKNTMLSDLSERLKWLTQVIYSGMVSGNCLLHNLKASLCIFQTSLSVISYAEASVSDIADESDVV